MTEVSLNFQNKNKKVFKFLSESDSDKVWNMNDVGLGYRRLLQKDLNRTFKLLWLSTAAFWAFFSNSPKYN